MQDAVILFVQIVN